MLFFLGIVVGFLLSTPFRALKEEMKYYTKAWNEYKSGHEYRCDNGVHTVDGRPMTEKEKEAFKLRMKAFDDRMEKFDERMEAFDERMKSFSHRMKNGIRI